MCESSVHNGSHWCRSPRRPVKWSMAINTSAATLKRSMLLDNSTLAFFARIADAAPTAWLSFERGTSKQILNRRKSADRGGFERAET